MEQHGTSHHRMILFPEYEALKNEVKQLRIELSMLLLERDELWLIECHNIERIYLLAVGHLEYKAYELHCMILRLKRKIELIQATKNRQEMIHLTMIEQQLDEEFKQYQQQLNEQLGKLNDALAWKRSVPLTANEVKELKTLYRSIIKVLHPDLNPELSKEELALFQQAVEAYKRGDLATIRIISTLIADKTLPKQYESVMTVLMKEKERLKQSLQDIQAHMAEIKHQYPYTLKEWVEDEAKLEEKKRELEGLIKQLQEMNEWYQQKIEKMLR